MHEQYVEPSTGHEIHQNALLMQPCLLFWGLSPLLEQELPFCHLANRKVAFQNKRDSRKCRYLEQQLVFGDSLDGFDEEVTDGQPGLDVLLDSLEDGEHQVIQLTHLSVSSRHYLTAVSRL